MRHIAAIFLFTFLLFSCGQPDKYPYKTSDFRPELKKQLDKLANEKSLPSNDTTARNFLRVNCSKDELLRILNCNHPLLRIISYRTIVNRNEPDYFQILLNHLDDTAKVILIWDEDVVYNSMISDLMIEKLLYEKKMSRKQKDILIDSVLIHFSNLENAYRMIKEIEPNERYYQVIKSKAKIKTWNVDQMWTIYALSKFKKPEDVSFLKNIFLNCKEGFYGWTFKSIENFPDSNFFPILENYLETNFKIKEHFSYDFLKYYCRAVASFKNIKSANILASLAKPETYADKSYLTYNKEFIFRAIQKYNSPFYDSIYNELKPQMPEYMIKGLGNYEEEETTW